ncbi:MAG: hypothetical protein JJE51_00760 [Thermoanaerobaculia bacterium]|nr:hypothetical protein [Thermoanaerobaculia bacterium]
MTKYLLLATFVATLTSHSALAAEGDMSFVLLPIHTTAFGANGSLWDTDFVLMNTGPATAKFFPYPESFPSPNLPPRPLAKGYGLRLRPLGGLLHGRLFWIETAYVDQFVFSLRVRDLSRQSSSAGVEVPVVPEQDFREGVITLIDVPTDARFRHSLRVYHATTQPDQKVRVRVFPLRLDWFQPEPVNPIREFDLTLQPGADAEFPLRPEPSMQVVNNLFDVYPEARAFPRVRIEITPLSEGMKIWGFVATVNNETHEMTVSSPQ